MALDIEGNYRNCTCRKNQEILKNVIGQIIKQDYVYVKVCNRVKEMILHSTF